MHDITCPGCCLAAALCGHLLRVKFGVFMGALVQLVWLLFVVVGMVGKAGSCGWSVESCSNQGHALCLGSICRVLRSPWCFDCVTIVWLLVVAAAALILHTLLAVDVCCQTCAPVGGSLSRPAVIWVIIPSTQALCTGTSQGTTRQAHLAAFKHHDYVLPALQRGVLQSFCVNSWQFVHVVDISWAFRDGSRVGAFVRIVMLCNCYNVPGCKVLCAVCCLLLWCACQFRPHLPNISSL
jgi:hypothetical protein